MQRVLVISSFVAHGAVGLQATLPPLLRPRRDVIALPTVVLSNHPGHPQFAGDAIAPELLKAMIAALDANGWLRDIDAVLSGYLPTPQHVEIAANMVEHLRQTKPDITYLCDPVLGDEPKGLYIREDAAAALCKRLIPLADIVTPNTFELAYLTGVAVSSVSSAAEACRKLGAPRTAVTSLRETQNEFINIFVTPSATWAASVVARPNAPHGTGDLFAGLLLAALLDGATDDTALAHAVGGVDMAIARSFQSPDLDLAGLRWTADAVTPADTTSLPA